MRDRTMRGLPALFCTLVFAVFPVLQPAAAQTEAQDLSAHMIEANRAQIVMLAEGGLVEQEQAARIADALRRAAEEDGVAGTEFWPDYLDLEARLTELIGPEASNLHIGRSRNDLGAVIARMYLREMALEHLEGIASVREILHGMAAEHVETVMPGFTHAVQAQPTTLAHLLLGFDAALDRDAQRLREIYARINKSPLGTAAFATSGFALDRELLADLLGFPDLVENSYDAIMISPGDSKVEYASALGLSALNVGRLLQYFIFQYDVPAPGILLTGDMVSRSSIMPQKRNPSAIERLRLRASEVVANAHASALFVHNTPMYEVKEIRQDHLKRFDRFATDAKLMYEELSRVLESLTIRPDVLREQVNDDFSTMTELADMLYREAGVSFRTGYSVASELSSYGRREGKPPLELTHEEVASVYREVTGETLPLSAADVKRAFDPGEIIRSRKVRGGPQPEETRRMLTDQQREVSSIRSWIEGERSRLEAASRELHRRFDALADNGEQ